MLAKTGEATVTANGTVTTSGTVQAGANITLQSTNGNVTAGDSITATAGSVSASTGTGNVSVQGVTAGTDISLTTEQGAITTNGALNAANKVNVSATTSKRYDYREDDHGSHRVRKYYNSRYGCPDSDNRRRLDHGRYSVRKY